MLNSEEHNIESAKEPMSQKAKGRKRIYNPTTGTFYRIRQRSSDKGAKGTIIGKWKPPSEKPKRRHKKR